MINPARAAAPNNRSSAEIIGFTIFRAMRCNALFQGSGLSIAQLPDAAAARRSNSDDFSLNYLRKSLTSIVSNDGDQSISAAVADVFELAPNTDVENQAANAQKISTISEGSTRSECSQKY
jgi:hypothetical protein